MTSKIKTQEKPAHSLRLDQNPYAANFCRKMVSKC